MYLIDPYKCLPEPDMTRHRDDITEQDPYVRERKYEVDSLCYPIGLHGSIEGMRR